MYHSSSGGAPAVPHAQTSDRFLARTSLSEVCALSRAVCRADSKLETSSEVYLVEDAGWRGKRQIGTGTANRGGMIVGGGMRRQAGRYGMKVAKNKNRGTT